ncbi:hypothetical protein UAW_03104 [Enterococcus haemoperoxidus ATCC BAA-382]|uniref:OmpR/PhoB-type domain-containing protein n=1 Tax=Enterococcus haemoperoxidus ATCC BAA-382 TaxID=1158608 RepID=R2SWK9_9ENTE|nr:winged helix-turn-helix domain-containing protein [Enterococcus haemoperoxidus]EOH92439.1 hypothetical protein UAW_03104 [Enterococcus haemoperoxidus ATCC BAA-382]EOT61805.1 hypothetical protein I583_00787 [Enterococcus haemoperoxidus ATCC BAA-382]OJG53923.1 hypothetical protein RV06_GL000542 [Enterococcus haemoperoxidus]
MYVIGYIASNNEISEQHKKLFESLHCQIQLIEKEKVVQLLEKENNVLQHIETLIIDVDRLSNFNWVCEIIMNLRKQTTLPLWILTSSNYTNRTNRIVYLQLGVDGVLDKEHGLDEPILMMRNLMQRFKQQVTPKNTLSSESVQFKLIPQNLSVSLNHGEEVNLTKLEFLTIEYLHKHARETMTYEDIYENVWNDSYGNRKYRVSNLVFHLRKKLESDIEKPKYIKTIRSKGYMLNV